MLGDIGLRSQNFEEDIELFGNQNFIVFILEIIIEIFQPENVTRSKMAIQFAPVEITREANVDALTVSPRRLSVSAER
jgi:hypothetical protein